MGRLAALPGVTITPDATEKQPSTRLAALTADHGASFLKIMGWGSTSSESRRPPLRDHEQASPRRPLQPSTWSRPAEAPTKAS